eukprot:758194_1
MDVEEDNNEFEDDDDNEFEDGDNDDEWDDDENKGGDDEGWGDVIEETDAAIIGINKPDLSKQISSIVALSPEDIDRSVIIKVNQLSEELSLDKTKCLLLLRRYKWNITKIIDVYFTDSDKILIGAGVCINPKKTIRYYK